MEKIVIIIIFLFNNILIFYVFLNDLNKTLHKKKKLEQIIVELIDHKGLLSNSVLEEELVELIESNNLMGKTLANSNIIILEKSLRFFIMCLLFLISIVAYLDESLILYYILYFKQNLQYFFISLHKIFNAFKPFK